MKYTINWDDPDPNGRVQPYNLVALNKEPNADQIGLGTVNGILFDLVITFKNSQVFQFVFKAVLFIQGTYRYGENTGPIWRLGQVTKIVEVDGEKLYRC